MFVNMYWKYYCRQLIKYKNENVLVAINCLLKDPQSNKK